MKTLRFAVVLVVLSTSGLANASIVGTYLTFTGAELNAFTVQWSDPGYDINNLGTDVAADAITANPKYSDGLFPMSGDAGATGFWPTAGYNTNVQVFFGSSFAATDLSGLGLTDLTERAFNDNDDLWGHDVWIDISDNGKFDPIMSAIVDINGTTAGSPTYAILSLDVSTLDLSTVVGWGVSVHGSLVGGDRPSSGDAFHSSWAAIPEPGAIVIWSLLGLVGTCVTWKRIATRLCLLLSFRSPLF